jgi:hypothetical protein
MRRLTPGLFAIERSANRRSRASWDIERTPLQDGLDGGTDAEGQEFRKFVE